MADRKASKVSIGSFLRSRPAKEQVVLIDRLLGDANLPANQEITLRRLRSALMVDLVVKASPV